MKKVIFSWLQAARLPSLSYILIPILLGTSIAYSKGYSISTYSLVCLLCYGVANQLFIVFGNDYADQETDALNQTFTIFSGGSRTLVEGKLSPKSILYATILFATFMLLLSIYFSILKNDLVFIILTLASIALLYAYSYPPFKLSYRGGGEILQALGVGFILPLFAYRFFSLSFSDFELNLLPVLFLINLSCAMATSLPDYPSDLQSSKKTVTVTFGNLFVKISILILESISFVYLLTILKNLNFPYSNIFICIMVLCILFSFLGLKSKPKEKLLSMFVFFSILFTLSLQIHLILSFYF
ncbi:MAG: prenyltransferase [Leptospira sp.]|nr:prenyltransferase [Leptospira sp.]